MINQYDKVIQKRVSVMVAGWAQIQEQKKETPLQDGKSGKELSAVYPVRFDPFGHLERQGFWSLAPTHVSCCSLQCCIFCFAN